MRPISRAGAAASLVAVLVLLPTATAHAGVYTYMSAYARCQADKTNVDWGGKVYSDKWEGEVQLELFGLSPQPVPLDSETRPFKSDGTTPSFFFMNFNKQKKVSPRYPHYRSVITFRRGGNWTSGTYEC